MSLSQVANILICQYSKPIKVHLWKGPEVQRRRIRSQVDGLTLAVPSVTGTLKSLSFSRCLLTTSVGPTFSTALRDKGWRQAASTFQKLLCSRRGGEEGRKETAGELAASPQPELAQLRDAIPQPSS